MNEKYIPEIYSKFDFYHVQACVKPSNIFILCFLFYMHPATMPTL